MASFDSSSSESRGGLNRYYRQAWENLHETAGQKANHTPLRRKETLDEPGYRENYRPGNDNASELISESMNKQDKNNNNSSNSNGINNNKKRHHHHHHHHHQHGNGGAEWRQAQSHNRY